MSIKAVIFDMNGVIVDDESLHEIAFKEVCNSLGLDFTSKDYQKLCMGKTDEKGFEDIIKEFKLHDVKISDLVKDKSRKYLEVIEGNIKSLSGVLELIEELSKRFKLALTSSSNSQEVFMVIEYFKIKHFFDVIVTSNDVTRGKPNPEPYLLTAKRLNLDPEQCLVIEDSRKGVESAKAAGMYCIGFHNPFAYERIGKNQDLSMADLEVDSLVNISVEKIEKI